MKKISPQYQAIEMAKQSARYRLRLIHKVDTQLKNPTSYKGPPKFLWLLIDRDNGQDGVKYYTWYFFSRAAARKHKREQASNPNYARLVGPFKYVIV